ncbi:hypothetical protein FDP41_001144 [Naegleria fowleri]|uniref:Uncharacterized protein n=1 Tax=Naegleria fowleri TaxID=5763 RepID=A0A6A5BZI8_NAEFO|nr:uncharacterized protein FDP41_001144 [Naegleria fowleri]KAF0979991.1 hypothetical protein FDP41_001144 [Naegleria fowleri]CAG4710816.1 unnamed protein product [Naegleria fowleri]
MNNTHPHNTTMTGGVNWEQFPQGVLSCIACIVSLIWFCCSLKGMFKNQISLQRKLFVMIFCSCFIRTMQSLIFNQLCFRYNRDNPICPYISKVSQILDIYASSSNFVIYLILGLYWAEQYFTMKKIQDDTSYESSSGSETNTYFMKVRKILNIIFWVLSVLSFLFVTPFAILITVLDHHTFGYGTWSYQISRLVIRLILSWGICLTLMIFGLLVFRLYRKQDNSTEESSQSRKNIQKVALISIICTSAYFFLSCTNIATTIEWEWYSRFEYAYVFYITFALIELFANAILLAFLIPKPVAMAIGRCFSLPCCGQEESEKAIMLRNKLFYDNIISLDEETFQEFVSEQNDFESDVLPEESPIIYNSSLSSSYDSPILNQKM